MTNTDIVKKLIGSIHPAGDASRDGERFENLKNLCYLVAELVSEIEDVALRNDNAYEASVIKARDYAYSFLSDNLTIKYDHIK